MFISPRFLRENPRLCLLNLCSASLHMIHLLLPWLSRTLEIRLLNIFLLPSNVICGFRWIPSLAIRNLLQVDTEREVLSPVHVIFYCTRRAFCMCMTATKGLL